MTDALKHILAEQERLARSADPLREFRVLLEPMGVVQDMLRQHLGTLVDASRRISEVTQPVAGIADQAQHTWPSEANSQQIKDLLEPFNKTQEWLNQLRTDEAERWRQCSSLLADVERQLDEWPLEIRSQLAILLEKGWFLDPEMPIDSSGGLAAAFLDGREEDAQQWLVEYFTGRLEAIERTLGKRHPKRAALFSKKPSLPTARDATS